MSKEEAIQELKSLTGNDVESNHQIADDILLELIDDPDVKAAYDAIEKWYC